MAINGFENDAAYLDYESVVLDEIMACEVDMAKAVIDAWVPKQRLRVKDEEEFRYQLMNLLASRFARI
jgi:hypothetical protein